ncbi:MAG: HD domain-containing protein [Treponema sp.]|nr:HD domain-containing protein [Treponema sp.]
MNILSQYNLLLAKYKKVAAYAQKAGRVNRRLYNNYLKLQHYHNSIIKKTANQAKSILEITIKEKYPLIVDHRKRVIHVSPKLLKAIEMTKDEFISSIYIDLLFEKFLPRNFTDTRDQIIKEFHFPILLKELEDKTQNPEQNQAEDPIHLHPFLHLGISGKRVFNHRKKLFLYLLSVRDISPDIELLYYQKTDLIIETLSATNLRLLQAQKTIEAHKILLVSLVCSLVEEHNRETSRHLQNIRTITTCMIEEIYRLKLLKNAPYETFQYLKDIAYTSLLHDIGKVHVSKELIGKGNELSEAEFKKVQSHTVAGAAYIKKIIILFQNDPTFSRYIDFLMIPYNICLYHHERWDGSGYPQGLSGSRIPLPARIVAIADAYDAMRAPRSYNIPRSHQEAVAEIKRCSGTQFDPVLVKVFLNIERQLEDIHYD